MNITLKGFLSGRLRAAPVLKSTGNGKQVCQLRVAYSCPRGIDRTGFVDVETWGPVAKANSGIRSGSGVNPPGEGPVHHPGRPLHPGSVTAVSDTGSQHIDKEAQWKL